MKKFVMWLLVAGMVASLLLTGCPEPIDDDDDEVDIPLVIIMATHPVGTRFNAIGAGLASVLSAHLPTEVKVMPVSGPVEWTPMLVTEEVDLGVANVGDGEWAWKSLSVYGEALGGEMAPIRLLTIGSPNQVSIMTAADAEIFTAEDLRGKRMVTEYVGAPTLTAQAHAALANLGLTPEDVIQITEASVAAGVVAITEGRADAAGTAALGMGVVAELDATRGARYLSLDPSPEAVARAQEIWPCEVVLMEAGPVAIPEPTYMLQYDTYLMSRTTLSDETAYWIVKTLWDYNQELWPIHVGLEEWTTDRFVSTTAAIPYHPGAIKFYQEVGVWTAEMDDVQNELLKLEQ